MSRKSKVIIGIVMLAVGAGLVPTGLVANDYLIDEVYNGVPEALLGIKAQAIPELMDQIPPLATPDVLSGAKDQAIDELEGLLPIFSTPKILEELKTEAVLQLPVIINGSGAAQAINGTLNAAVSINGTVIAREHFFNSPTFQDNYSDWLMTPVMMGISNYWDGILEGGLDVLNLSFSENAQKYLLLGNGPLPGLTTDLELGFGVLGFMEMFVNATLGDMVLNATMRLFYNVTWNQIELVAGYIKNYLWDSIVKSQYFPMTIEMYAEILFYSQWANGTVVSNGIDLSLFYPSLPPDTKGLEAGVPTSTDINITTSIDLWDDSYPVSFTNVDGLFVWIGSVTNNTLEELIVNETGLIGYQINLVRTWLNNFITSLVPLFIFGETGMTIPEVAVIAFYEQWANGTIGGESVLPEGFLGMLNPEWKGAPYFEVGLPTPTGLSLAKCISLWDTENPNTFVHSDGILIWFGAALLNTTLQAELIAEFGISAIELMALLMWLGTIVTDRIGDLLILETGRTLLQLATVLFYEQWANGTIYRRVLLPDGFLSLRDPPLEGPPYFEVGLMYPSGILPRQARSLWDETSKFSLVTINGIHRWYQAELEFLNEDFDGTNIVKLMDQNRDLNIVQMGAILTWLPQFRDDIVTQLAMDEMGLNQKPYDLGQTLAISLSSAGGALAILGIIVLILSKRM
ncbi:MAG: hypothetical protein ACFFEN_15605 [Candidatus Thorarchaeota archaeon]